MHLRRAPVKLSGVQAIVSRYSEIRDGGELTAKPPGDVAQAVQDQAEPSPVGTSPARVVRAARLERRYAPNIQFDVSRDKPPSDLVRVRHAPDTAGSERVLHATYRSATERSANDWWSNGVDRRACPRARAPMWGPGRWARLRVGG